MPKQPDFDDYLDFLCESLGHSRGHTRRHQAFQDYCRGLMLPLERKSVEPLAASVAPYEVSARHQALHHFVSQSDWDDQTVLDRVAEWVVPALTKTDPELFWIIDDTGFPKKGRHSVGVARQYCGILGKQDNCQIAVSLSLANATASLPVQWRLYLPKDWSDDPDRCRKAGVPEAVSFATKTEIALSQIQCVHASKLPRGTVVADAGYGNDAGLRAGISELGLTYMLAVKGSTNVWAPGTAPLPPEPYSGLGRPPIRHLPTGGHRPMSVEALAKSLPAQAYRTQTWREGTNRPLSSRFAAVRIRAAHHKAKHGLPGPEEWLLIEWPKGEPKPRHYWLSTLDANATRDQLVRTAQCRWRIERDYQELKQEFGLGHYEGRNWRGFHHHATLCIAAYGYLVQQRLRHPHSKKNAGVRQDFALPEDYTPRGAPSRAASRR
jgi:SRSO17 transposase